MGSSVCRNAVVVASQTTSLTAQMSAAQFHPVLAEAVACSDALHGDAVGVLVRRRLSARTARGLMSRPLRPDVAEFVARNETRVSVLVALMEHNGVPPGLASRMSTSRLAHNSSVQEAMRTALVNFDLDAESARILLAGRERFVALRAALACPELDDAEVAAMCETLAQLCIDPLHAAIAGFLLGVRPGLLDTFLNVPALRPVVAASPALYADEDAVRFLAGAPSSRGRLAEVSPDVWVALADNLAVCPELFAELLASQSPTHPHVVDHLRSQSSLRVVIPFRQWNPDVVQVSDEEFSAVFNACLRPGRKAMVWRFDGIVDALVALQATEPDRACLLAQSFVRRVHSAHTGYDTQRGWPVWAGPHVRAVLTRVSDQIGLPAHSSCVNCHPGPAPQESQTRSYPRRGATRRLGSRLRLIDLRSVEWGWAHTMQSLAVAHLDEAFADDERAWTMVWTLLGNVEQSTTVDDFVALVNEVCR